MAAITVLVEYEDTTTIPSFNAGMEVLGGKITRVQFSNLFAELDLTVPVRQKILILLDQMEESNDKVCKEISGSETISEDDAWQFNGLAMTNNAIREVRKRIIELF